MNSHVSGFQSHRTPPAFHIPRKPVAISSAYSTTHDSDSSLSAATPRTIIPGWSPGAVKHVPWLGIAALFAATFCSIACALLLRFSDGQPTDAWRFSPTVYLAILSTSANICLTFALSKGATIA